MKTILLNIKTHLGPWMEKHCDIRVWEAYQNTTRRTSGDSEWCDNAGEGSVTLSDLHDAQNVQEKGSDDE